MIPTLKSSLDWLRGTFYSATTIGTRLVTPTIPVAANAHRSGVAASSQRINPFRKASNLQSARALSTRFQPDGGQLSA